MNADKLRTIFLFIGPPGSGKGTITSLCVSQFGWGHLSTGNLCRKHIIDQTDLGKQIDFALKSGKLVSDTLIASMVDQWLLEVKRTVDALILDGYPRTVVQAAYFHDFLERLDSRPYVQVVKFALGDDQIVQRLTNRYTCSNKECQAAYSLAKGAQLSPRVDGVCDKCGCVLSRRSDDVEHVIRDRLAMYHKHENELLQFYERHGYPMTVIQVDKSVDSVFLEFKKLAQLSD